MKCLISLAFGGVPVLDVRPKDWADDGKLLAYIHGGAFTLLSAKSTADNAALMASASGLREISIDYTNPPALQWAGVQEQIHPVFRQLLAGGCSMDRIAIYGDSAGGNLVVRPVLKLRDSGVLRLAQYYPHALPDQSVREVPGQVRLRRLRRRHDGTG